MIILNWPLEPVLFLSKTPQLHRQLAFLNFVLRKALQVAGEAKPRAQPDEPLGWIILPPFDRVAVVHRELVVEIVITLPNGHEGGEHVITWRVFVVKSWRVAEVVSEAVYAERTVVDDGKSSCTSIDEAAQVVTPEQTRDKGRHAEAHDEEKWKVPAVLPSDDETVAEVADVNSAWTAAWLDDHPTNVRPKEALVRVIRVEIRICITVVGTVTPTPPFDRFFNSS